MKGAQPSTCFLGWLISRSFHHFNSYNLLERTYAIACMVSLSRATKQCPVHGNKAEGPQPLPPFTSFDSEVLPGFFTLQPWFVKTNEEDETQWHANVVKVQIHYTCPLLSTNYGLPKFHLVFARWHVDRSLLLPLVRSGWGVGGQERFMCCFL